MYHVMARGNRRDSIFLDDDDRRCFLKTVGEACGMTGWRIHAWVLMGNHYHLLVQTPEANLVVGMKWVQNAYTRRFNTRHRQWGRLFGDRYKSVLVEGEGYYYQTLADYIHLNPVRAGIVRSSAGQSIMDYAWSSVSGGYALAPGKRVPWLAAADGLKEFGCADTAAGRRRFIERLDRRAAKEGADKAGIPLAESQVDARCSHLRRGWYWGSQAFAERILEIGGDLMVESKGRSGRSAQERRAHGEAQARSILKTGKRVLRLGENEIKTRPGSDERKVAIAKLIWERTTVSQGWIAEQLGMRSGENVSQQINRTSETKAEKQLRKALEGTGKLSILDS